MRFSYLSFLLLSILLILLYFVTHGAVISDEGYILQSTEKLLNGYLPYRDFSFSTTPLSLFLTGISFALFNYSILSSRLLILIVYLISSLLIFKTVSLATKNSFYATLAILLFVSWAPSHINFSYPPVYSLATAILCCYLLMKFTQTRSERYLFLAGISAFSVLLAEHFFGIFFIISLLVFFLVKHARSFSVVSIFLYGYIWSFIFFCVYLLANQSFSQFINDVFQFPILLQPSLFQKSILQNSLYFMPILTSSASFVLLYIRRRFHLLFMLVFVISYFIAGIFSYGNSNLALSMSIIGIPVALYLRYNVSSNVRLMLIVFSFISIFVGFYTGIFNGYYNSQTPLSKNSFFFAHPKVNVFIDKKMESDFNELIAIAKKYTVQKDYIFINAYKPMLYFVLDRKEPIRHSYLFAGQIPEKYYAEVKGNLIAKKVRLIFIEKKSIDSLPIKNFVDNNYNYLMTVGNLDVYLLRS